MITDSFLNLCGAILSSDETDFNETVVKDVHSILTFYQEKEGQIPLPCKPKFDLIYTISRLRKEGKEIDEVFDSVTAAGQFKDQDSVIARLSATTKQIPDKKVESALARIRSQKKFTTLLKDLPSLENFVEQFNTSSFSDLDGVMNSYEMLISKMYSRVSEEKRLEAHSTIKTLDMATDNYAPVLKQIELSYTGKNSITTGYPGLDENMNGGFEPARLYIFGGASGDGKSVLLANCVRNAVEREKARDEKTNIYIYVTLENLIDESLARIYCSHTEKDLKKVIKNYQEEKHVIEQTMKTWQEDNNSAIIMAYFPPTITSVADLLVFVDEIKNRYKDRGVVRGIYIDYLDLLMAGQKFDLHRLEMGQITIDLKVLAVRLQVPVITVTQVNRSGYDHKENMSLTQIGEAIKKVEHSDFVAMIRSSIETNEEGEIITDTGNLKVTIGKNRSGPKNKSIDLLTRFSFFRIDPSSRITSVPFERKTVDIMPESVL